MSKVKFWTIMLLLWAIVGICTELYQWSQTPFNCTTDAECEEAYPAIAENIRLMEKWGLTKNHGGAKIEP